MAPDQEMRVPPDGRVPRAGLESGMSIYSKSSFPPFASGAAVWEDVTVVSARADSRPAEPGWRPAVNAYRCARAFVVFVEAAGVPPSSLRVEARPTRLVVRGLRPQPEPDGGPAELAQLLALEIDHGAFERVLELPQEIDPAAVASEYRDGLLRILLPLRPGS
jgi:HSP20 family protein